MRILSLVPPSLCTRFSDTRNVGPSSSLSIGRGAAATRDSRGGLPSTLREGREMLVRIFHMLILQNRSKILVYHLT